MKYRLQDLIDVEQFQMLQDRLNEIYSFPSAIIDNEGNILTATAWQEVCTQFHRKHPACERECIKSDQYILSHLAEAQPAVTYRCPHGLVDNATPIVIEGIHYGNFFTGQFFLEPPDLEFFKAQARQYGFEESAYLAAVRTVPVWSADQLNHYLFFIKGLIAVISESGLKRLREQEQRQHIAAVESRAQAILETAMDGFMYLDADGRLLAVNETYCRMSGYGEQGLLRMRITDLEAVENAAATAHHIAQVKRTGQDRFETQHRRQDGSVYDVEVSVRYRPEGEGRMYAFFRDNSERNQTMKALRASEARFRTLMEHAGDGFELVDSAGRYRDVNSASLRQLGYTREEMLGLTIFEVDPQVDHEEFARTSPGLSADSPLRLETVHRRKDGSTFPVEVAVSRLDLGGAPHFLTLVRDITERKHMENRLQHSHQLLQYIIAHARSAIAVHDRELRYVYVSERYLQEYKLQEHDIIGKHHYEVFPDLPQKWREVHQRALAGEVSSAEADSYHRADGTVEWTRWECRPWYEASGGIGGIIVYTEVITERVRAEEQIRKLSQAVEQSPVSIVITDLAGAIEYVNPKFTQLTGYAPAEVRGQNPRVLQGTKTPRSEYARLWQTITQGGQWTGELHNRKKNGEYYWENATISPILDARGRITHYLALKEDITQRKALEEQLHQSQKLESIGQLAGGVAHDFNNILAAMMMNLSHLQENLLPNQEAQESLEELGRAAERAANLTRQLLMFGRRSVLEVKTVDLNEVIINFLKMLNRLIGEHIHISFNQRAGLPPIAADTGMIEQVLMNLCVNARDAMPQGGKLTIHLEAAEITAEQAQAHPGVQPGRFVRMSVADTGRGMDEATQRRIFEPFFTTKEAGKGTGLGLATVHGIIGQHRGWVEVESQIGLGTTFAVYLPAAVAPAGPLMRSGSDAPVPGGTETILVVEDEPHVRRATVKMLRRLGYVVWEAASAPEAIQLWNAQPRKADLLLTDMVMPGGMTGRELAEQLRATCPGLKVIIASGYSAEIVDHGIPRAMRVARLQKPFSLETLSQAIRESLGSAAAPG